MRIVFMGTPEFAVPVLQHLIFNHHEVVAVYTQPDRPSGRGRTLAFSPVKKVVMAWNLPVVQPTSLKRAEAVEQLSSFIPDIIVVAAYGQILPPAVLDMPPRGALNVHPSLLPRHRGASPVAAAILAGDEFTGVSIMLMDAGLDTGPVLGMAQIPIEAQDTTGSLTAKLSQIGARLLPEVLLGWMRGEIKPQPQNEAEATYSHPISKEDGEINWRLPAVDLWRRVRAFQPWPGCYTKWQGRQLKIVEAVPITGDVAFKVGEAVSLQKPAFGIGTGKEVLGVLKVQLEGRRVMSADEFLRGARQFIGSMLPS